MHAVPSHGRQLSGCGPDARTSVSPSRLEPGPCLSSILICPKVLADCLACGRSSANIRCQNESKTQPVLPLPPSESTFSINIFLSWKLQSLSSTASSTPSPLPGGLSLLVPSLFLQVPFTVMPIESCPDALTEDRLFVTTLMELCSFLLRIYPDS